MDQLDREVIESLSEPAKRVFGSLDYRSRQRMLKKAKAIEYYGAAEPPVRCGESHLSGLTEPPHFVY